MRSIIGYLVPVGVLGALAYFGFQTDHKAFVSSLFAAFLSAFVVFFVESMRRPQLSIVKEITPPPTPGRKFLRVHVENRALSWPLKLILDRRPIYQARARITFLTETNDPVFGSERQMVGRWSNTSEPVRPIFAFPQGPNGTPGIGSLWDLSATRDAVDIGSGAYELLDVVMRNENEGGCRGWHNRMISRPNTPPEDQFELPQGRYRALVRVDASGRSFKALFRIVCDTGIQDFRLEPIKRLPRGV
jgi:hypothetical protein